MACCARLVAEAHVHGVDSDTTKMNSSAWPSKSQKNRQRKKMRWLQAGVDAERARQKEEQENGDVQKKLCQQNFDKSKDVGDELEAWQQKCDKIENVEVQLEIWQQKCGKIIEKLQAMKISKELEQFFPVKPRYQTISKKITKILVFSKKYFGIGEQLKRAKKGKREAEKYEKREMLRLKFSEFDTPSGRGFFGGQCKNPFDVETKKQLTKKEAKMRQRKQNKSLLDVETPKQVTQEEHQTLQNPANASVKWWHAQCLGPMHGEQMRQAQMDDERQDVCEKIERKQIKYSKGRKNSAMKKSVRQSNGTNPCCVQS